MKEGNDSQVALSSPKKDQPSTHSSKASNALSRFLQGETHRGKQSATKENNGTFDDLMQKSTGNAKKHQKPGSQNLLGLFKNLSPGASTNRVLRNSGANVREFAKVQKSPEKGGETSATKLSDPLSHFKSIGYETSCASGLSQPNVLQVVSTNNLARKSDLSHDPKQQQKNHSPHSTSQTKPKKTPDVSNSKPKGSGRPKCENLQEQKAKVEQICSNRVIGSRNSGNNTSRHTRVSTTNPTGSYTLLGADGNPSEYFSSAGAHRKGVLVQGQKGGCPSIVLNYNSGNQQNSGDTSINQTFVQSSATDLSVNCGRKARGSTSIDKTVQYLANNLTNTTMLSDTSSLRQFAGCSSFLTAGSNKAAADKSKIEADNSHVASQKQLASGTLPNRNPLLINRRSNLRNANGQAPLTGVEHLLASGNLIQSSVPAPLVGKFNEDDFDIGEQLGKGRYGEVYLATHKKTSMIMAIKVMNKNTITKYRALKQLVREARIHSFLDHPNIIRNYGILHDEEQVYLLMEYAPEGNLYTKLKEKGCFDEVTVANYTKQVISAFRYLQDRQILHRDLKPENLLLGFDGELKLADFGWAIQLPGQANMRQTFCGTLDYISPEMAQGNYYGVHTDNWSIGILVFELLTGGLPFIRNNYMDLMGGNAYGEINYPDTLSPLAKSFISRLLATDPLKRMTLQDALRHPFIQQPSDFCSPAVKQLGPMLSPTKQPAPFNS